MRRKGLEASVRLTVSAKNAPIDVRIRPYRLDDAPVVLEAARESLADLQPWMPWCHPEYSIDESRSWLETQVPAFEQASAFEFAIVSADGWYLGGCGLNQIDKINRRANLGYWVRSSATRRGVATEAARLIRDWGFQNTDLIRLELVIAAENVASQRVAGKSGAIREGILRSRLLLHGVAHDAIMFSFVRPYQGA
jgi:ribosomal-protein-serine acetyltransferase